MVTRAQLEVAQPHSSFPLINSGPGAGMGIAKSSGSVGQIQWPHRLYVADPLVNTVGPQKGITKKLLASYISWASYYTATTL